MFSGFDWLARRCLSHFTAVVCVIASGPAIAGDCKLGVMADLPVTMDGMRASVPVKVNGKDTRFWLDSGALFNMMPPTKAKELGLELLSAPQNLSIVGARGKSNLKTVLIKTFGLGDQEAKNIEFLVGGDDWGNGSIGRNLLSLADTEFDLAHGSVKLIKATDCDKTGLAYWAKGSPYFTVPLNPGRNANAPPIRLPASINGVKIDAELDTGASNSWITRAAAEGAGIDLTAPGVRALPTFAIPRQRPVKAWIVPVENISIGDEQILKSRITVVDRPYIEGVDTPDMLLGIDFILAHRIYVANSQRRVFFTYSGGRPFSVYEAKVEPVGQAPAPLPPGTKRISALKAETEPSTADEYARRGSARIVQNNVPGALADFSEAIRLTPDEADYYAARAKVHRQAGNAQLAQIDFDKALSLDPANGDLLKARGFLRISINDKAGALADAEAAEKATHSPTFDFAELAFLYERLGKAALAVPMLDRVISPNLQDAKTSNLLNSRCWNRALANIEIDKALEDCDTAIRSQGAYAAYLDSRALAYFRKGNFTKALADYDAALKLRPNGAWSLYVRSLIKTKQGDAAGAGADMTAALAVNPKIAEDARMYGIGS